MTTIKEIKQLLKENKTKEDLAFDTRDDDLLAKAFKEYDVLFSRLLREQEKQRLIQKGVQRIKDNNRINTEDFKDIIEDLGYYGLGFVDAQNQIIGLYEHEVGF